MDPNQTSPTQAPPPPPVKGPEYEVDSHNEIEETKQVSKKLVFIISLILAILIPVAIFVYSKYQASKTYTATLAPTPIAKPTPTPDPTAGWQTYTATSSGFSFRYPGSWFVSGGGENTSITLSDVQNVYDEIPTNMSTQGHNLITVATFPDSLPTNFPYTNGQDILNPTIKSFTLDGQKAIRGQQTSELGLADRVMVTNPTGGIVDIDNNFGETKIFDLILSTFKFTEPTSSAETATPSAQ